MEPAFYLSFLHFAARAIETAGVSVILLGALVATLIYVLDSLKQRGEAADNYARYRGNLGRGILLGLEFLIAADIVGTVAVDPTWWNVGVLGGIVLIRTFLSFTLEYEIHGTLPGQKKEKGTKSRK